MAFGRLCCGIMSFKSAYKCTRAYIFGVKITKFSCIPITSSTLEESSLPSCRLWLYVITAQALSYLEQFGWRFGLVVAALRTSTKFLYMASPVSTRSTTHSLCGSNVRVAGKLCDSSLIRAIPERLRDELHIFCIICKNVFYVFILVTFLKIKNVENLLSMQANSEISVLHLTNDRLNCSGLLLLFQLSLWLPGPII